MSGVQTNDFNNDGALPMGQNQIAPVVQNQAPPAMPPIYNWDFIFLRLDISNIYERLTRLAWNTTTNTRIADVECENGSLQEVVALLEAKLVVLTIAVHELQGANNPDVDQPNL